MKKLPSLMFLLVLLLFLLPVQAAGADIWASNSTGNERNSFYTNDTVYVTSDSITSGAASVDVYITTDNNTWPDNTTLNDVSTGYKTISTNASGQVPTTAIWSNPAVGSYDIVVDVDRDGRYNSSTDYVDNASTTGFEVTLAPIPTITATKGDNSPASHSWEAGNASYNVMLQIKLTAGSVENVRMNSIGITAGGSGDDSSGISTVLLVLDANNNSEYDPGESLLAYGNYLWDDGVLMMTIEDGYDITKNDNASMIIAYTMHDGSDGDTFYFNLVSIGATGATSGGQATTYGLPITSATKTIAVTATTTTTTTTIATTTTTAPTTTIPTTTTLITTTTLPEGGKIDYTLAAIIVTIVAAAAVGIVIFIKMRPKKEVYSYKELKEKWK